MKIYALLIYTPTYDLKYKHYDLSDLSFIYRYFAENTIENIALKSLNHIESNQIYKILETVNDMEIIIYGQWYSDYNIIITDREYPSYLVYSLFEDLKSVDNIDSLWFKYCDGKHADKIQHVKSELTETKAVVMSSLDKLYERHENLEVLIEKADELESVSKIFVEETKTLNKCCVLF